MMRNEKNSLLMKPPEKSILVMNTKIWENLAPSLSCHRYSYSLVLLVLEYNTIHTIYRPGVLSHCLDV